MNETKEYFETSLNHLFSELRRIELKLKIQAVQMRQKDGQAVDDKFRGLYISDSEIDNILNDKPIISVDLPQSSEKTALSPLLKSLAQTTSSNSDRKAESLRLNISLRLFDLEKSFDLSKFGIDCILMCMLPEIDLRFQKLFGYIQDDVTKKYPGVDLLIRTSAENSDNPLKLRGVFASESPLLTYRLLIIEEDRNHSIPLLARLVRIDERILNYLLEVEEIDKNIRPFSNLIVPALKFDQVILDEEIKSKLKHFTGYTTQDAPVCFFQGRPGTGRKTTAEAICHELGQRLLTIDMERLLGAGNDSASLIRLVFREGLLEKSAIYLDNCNLLFDKEKSPDSNKSLIFNELARYPFWSFIATEKGQCFERNFNNRPSLNIEFATPSANMRDDLWKQNKDNLTTLAEDADLSEVSNRFKLNGGQIRSAALAARNIALWRNPGKLVIEKSDLFAACRNQSNSNLSSLARKINPKYDWSDIVLPKDQIDQLSEMCNYVKYYQTVYGAWGFERKLSLGKGLNALFAGLSGTGKTMAAEIMAKQLGIDLYKINLSAIVSKYIGETEKNLENIFYEAQTANSILFFDEADALFGKRSEVKDAHDRYANIEIAYLLQRMEEYDGIVILATNLQKNLDEAFVRRLHYNIEFPMPEESDRLRIWKQVFPQEAPLAGDIDLDFMARQFKISGGNIKNIALGAAFLAASNGGLVKMDHLIRSTRREFQKMGKLCTEGDFTKYFELVKN
jgi:SpoVK/Ycf46/Vps4 family AAA+-type ATPase